MFLASNDPKESAGLIRRSSEYAPPPSAAGGQNEASASWRIDEDIQDPFPLHDDLILANYLTCMPGMVYHGSLDAEWSLEFVSEGCYELTGYPPEDFVDRKVITYSGLIHPEDRQPVLEAVQTALKGARIYDLVYRIITASGEEKWVRELGRGFIVEGGEVPMLEGFVADITDCKVSERRVRRSAQRFEALRQIDRSFNSSLDLRVTLEVLLDQLCSQMQVDAVTVLLLNPVDQVLEYVAGRGFRTSSLQNTRLKLGEGYGGIAALERQSVSIPNLAVTPGGFSRTGLIEEEGFVSYYAQPLIAKGQVKGVVEIFQRRWFEPDEEARDFLEALATHAATVIETASLFNDLQRTNIELSLAYDSALMGWSKALELRDQETAGHTQRVTELTLRIARALGMSARDLVHIRRGAILHDIGKMDIPESIWLKKERLSPEEWSIIRSHPLLTYELLSPIPYLRPALNIPYCHHERWDGRGYPRGLRGEQIPLEARIFAVADVWDALTSDRPYRRAWPRARAFEYIRENAGKHFDPKVVELFFKIMGES